MATGGLAQAPSAGASDSRTRSVWLTQLVLAASVLTISVLVLFLQPELFTRWTFALGVLAIVVVSLATLAVPWIRLPQSAVLAVPFLDALAIGLVASDTDLRFGYLWAFPVMWVAMHFSAAALGAMLAVIAAILLVDAIGTPSPVVTLRLFIVLLSVLFIGITTHLAMRQMRAFRRLQRRQARRLKATAERRADQERRANEILNGVDTGVARLSASGTVLTVNHAYSRLYGLDPIDPNLPGTSVEYAGRRGMPLPPLDRPFARAVRGETFSDARVWLFTPKGEWRALSISAKRLSSSEDEEPSTLLVVHDVTAITYAQRERERLNAIASHELKHPLTVMIGNAELALEADDLTPRMRERLETMLGASERMLEMAGSMLRTGRSTGTGNESLEEIDLRQIVRDSVGSFRPTAATREVTLDLRLDDPLPVTADGFRMRQVVDNLVSNAIKYTPRDGAVRITSILTDDTVALIVTDTGIGISSADLPHVLTPYFRTAQAQETASGTGLGLGISREIVAVHGGTLSVDSELGVGTVVTVTMPRTPPRFASAGGDAR